MQFLQSLGDDGRTESFVCDPGCTEDASIRSGIINVAQNDDPNESLQVLRSWNSGSWILLTPICAMGFALSEDLLQNAGFWFQKAFCASTKLLEKHLRLASMLFQYENLIMSSISVILSIHMLKK